MPKKSNSSVLIDTGFLITIFDTNKEHHEIAKQYYQYFIDNSIIMYLSAIVIAEYQHKGSIEDILDSDNFIPLPFNAPDGIITGNFARFLGKERGKDASRLEAKDDIKLLAQCSSNNIDYAATCDKSTFAKYCRRLSNENMLKTKVIVPDKFDSSLFTEDGQMPLLPM